jgi:hypothetical protein
MERVTRWDGRMRTPSIPNSGGRHEESRGMLAMFLAASPRSAFPSRLRPGRGADPAAVDYLTALLSNRMAGSVPGKTQTKTSLVVRKVLHVILSFAQFHDGTLQAGRPRHEYHHWRLNDTRSDVAQLK